MQTLEDSNRRYDNLMRAKAIVAHAVGVGLYRAEPEKIWHHVEAAAGSSYANILHKTTIDPATTFSPTWAGPLGERRLFSDAFLGLVKPRTVVDRISTLRAPMNVNVPVQDGDVTFDWVGEGQPVPLGKLSIDDASLPPSKIAGIVAFTKELARNSAAQSIIEQRMVNATAQGTDDAFLDPTRAAVSDVSPASITNGATQIASTGITASALETDIKALFAALSGGSPERPYLAMSPTVALHLATLRSSGERVFPDVGLLGGTILGVPVLVSPRAYQYIIALDGAGIVVAETGVEIKAATQAGIQMSDSPTNGAGILSLFQSNTVALMVQRWITWARRDDAAAYIDLPIGSPA